MTLAPDALERFRLLYEEMLPVVFGYARARMGRSEAEDVTADVFHAAATRAQAGDLDALTAPWLMTVTRNKVIDQWRRSERHSRAIVAARTNEVLITLSEHQPEHEYVLEALDDLRPDYRAVLILKLSLIHI